MEAKMPENTYNSHKVFLQRFVAGQKDSALRTVAEKLIQEGLNKDNLDLAEYISREQDLRDGCSFSKLTYEIYNYNKRKDDKFFQVKWKVDNQELIQFLKEL